MSAQNAGTIATGGPAPESGQSNLQATQAEPSVWMTPAQSVESDALGNQATQPNVQQSQSPLAAMGLEKFQSVEALAEAYKNMERQFTQVNQEYSQVKPLYEQLIERQLFGNEQSQLGQQVSPQQIAQTNQVLDYLRLDRETFWNKVNENPHEVLPAVSRSIFDEQAKPLIDRLEKLEQSAQARFSMMDELQTQAKYVNIKNQYSQVDPDFDGNIQKAAQFLISPQGKAFLASNPGNALEMAYKAQLAERMIDPAWQQQMGQAMQMRQQQQQIQASMANPMTSSPSMQMPGHSPMVAPNVVPGRQTVAKDIAAFNEPFGLQNFNVIS